MPRVGINIIVNYAGSGASMLLTVALVPLYIKYLGVEAYGLVGFFALLQAWAALLDFGITPTISREIARYRAGAAAAGNFGRTFSTLEGIYLGLAGCILAAVWFSADLIASGWLQSRALSRGELTASVRAMAIAIAVRWVSGLYRGAIQGAEQQVWLNLTTVGWAVFRSGGAILLLAAISNDLLLFFVWQALAVLAESLAMVIKARRLLPSGYHPYAFYPTESKRVLRFASGMTFVSASAITLSQIDRLVLSAILDLNAYGKYIVAGTLAQVLYLVTYPIATALTPRFNGLHAQGKNFEVKRAFEYGAEMTATIVAPAAIGLILFGEGVLYVWTGRVDLAQEVAPILRVLTLGTALGAIINIPCSLYLSRGKMTAVIIANVTGAVSITILMITIVPLYGSIAAAWLWAGYNVVYLFVALPVVFKECELWFANWLFKSTLMPAGACFASGALVMLCLPKSAIPNVRETAFHLVLATGVLTITAASTTAAGRVLVQQMCQMLRSLSRMRLGKRRRRPIRIAQRDTGKAVH